MNGFWKNKKGITLIALTVTIITLLILVGVIIVTLIGDNGILTRSRKAIILSEVGEINEKIKLKVLNEGEAEKITGKLSKIDANIDSSLIDKYNDILYVKNGNLYLDFIADFPNAKLYINNKEKIETTKETLAFCYDGIKEYNKIQNGSFDNGLNGMETRMTKGNVTEVINENGNNYLHIEMYLSSGNTQWVRVGNSKIANKYEDKCYAFIKYRNEHIPSEDGFVLNNDIITLSRFGRGYDQILLNKNNFIKSYNLGWSYVSTVRKIESKSSSLGLVFSLGGGPGNGQKQEYSIDFDDIYIINLTEVFGEGSEPQKQELDAIFSNF